MHKYLLIFFSFFSLLSSGQTELLDSISLAVFQEYTDLDLALQDKDHVVKLSLRKKKYKSFPMEILQFKNLQFLDISKNSIKELPDSIVTLTKLQYLICSKTGLERLPVNIGEMANLKHINASQNELTTLPYGFGSLSNLEYADFWDNNMDEFPSSMKELTKLKTMDLRNIIISKTKQDALQQQLPKTKIYFSAPCNCGG